MPKKCCLGPQNDPKSLGTQKLEKNKQNGNLALNQWNRWVATDIHLYNSSPIRKKLFPFHQVPASYEENFSNLIHGEPLSLMKKFPCFDDQIEFYSLLVGVLYLGIDDPINFRMFDARRIYFCRG
jgi:hypothetical protein